MKKISFLLVLFVGLSTTGFSQSKKAMQKIEKKATELAEKLDAEIKAGDATLGLSEDQKAKVIKIHTERIVAIRKLGKEASKEDKQKVNKAHFQKVFKDVLTKEQVKARKKGKQQ